jgi:hypothetical protein
MFERAPLIIERMNTTKPVLNFLKARVVVQARLLGLLFGLVGVLLPRAALVGI